MSSIFEISQQLLLILSLAASGEAPFPGPAPNQPVTATYGADGPLRFSEQVWLESLKHGHGGEEFASIANRIFRTSHGRYYVPAEADRGYILSLRRDGDIAGLVALRLAKTNAKILEAKFGRPAGASEIYLAHAVGAETAGRLIALAAKSPDAETAGALPEIGEKMPEALFHQGRPSRLRELLANLKRAVRGPKRNELLPQQVASGAMPALRPSVEPPKRMVTRAPDLAHASWDPVVTRAR